MKKLIAALIATLATTQAYAQGTSSSMATSLRPKRASGFVLMPAVTVGGTQFTSLADYSNQAKAVTGMSYSIGAMGEIGRGTFVFQTGLLYMQQSAKAETNQTTQSGGGLKRANYVMDYSSSYLAIPLALKARTRIAEGVRLVGRIGVMPAFFLSHKAETTGSYSLDGMNERPVNDSVDTKDGVRKFNAFGVVGAGPEFAIAKNQNLRVELGYERMLMSIAEKSEVNNNPTSALHSLNVMLSYGIGI